MSMGSSVRVGLDGEVACLSLHNGRGNALNPKLVEDLLDALRLREVAEDARALVLTGNGEAFCDGLDLDELLELDRDRLLAFLDRLQGLLVTLYVWSRPVVAAVNGVAASGGCLLALCADWRILARGRAAIGLPDIALGLPLFQAGLEIGRAQLTPRCLAEAAYGGELHPPDAALRLGLADEVLDPNEVLVAAHERARSWARRPAVAFHRVKAGLRDRVLLAIRERHEEQQEEWVNLWFAPAAQERLRKARDRRLQRA